MLRLSPGNLGFNARRTLLASNLSTSHADSAVYAKHGSVMDKDPSDQDNALLTRLNALKESSVSLEPSRYGARIFSSSVGLDE